MRLGVKDVSFDLTMPPFIPALLEEAGVPAAQRPALMRALDRKDAAAVAQHGGALAATLIALLDATGAAEHTVAQLAELTLPPKARIVLDRLIDTVAAVREICPDLRMTVDPVEFRGWKYHTGVCVTLFAVGRSEELGRGGRYLCNDNEPACGLTLRPDVLFRMIPPHQPRTRVSGSRCQQAGSGSFAFAGIRHGAGLCSRSTGRSRGAAFGLWHHSFRHSAGGSGLRACPRVRFFLFDQQAVFFRSRPSMSNVTVIGAQWGDEGKGKIVDWLASRADVVVRFQGGHNAGHTLVVGNQVYKLSLLPSGVVSGKLGIIGNGVVVDPQALLAEIARIGEQG